MQALVFEVSIPRYVLSRAVGKQFPKIHYGRGSSLSLRELEAPRLPGADWVRLKSLMCGLCGSDLSTIFYKQSPIQQRFYSFPAVLGHEILAEVKELGPQARGFEVGEKVAVNPIVPCALRGISPPCGMCARGLENGCENTAEGHLAPGILIGFHKDLPGGMSDELVAHPSQLHRVPHQVSDGLGVLTEPVAVCTHAVLKSPPRTPDEKVLVIGGGPIALATLWALRALGHKNPVTLLTVERYQQELARQLGADEVMTAQADKAETEDVARRTGGKVYYPDLGPPAIQGGFELIYDCVGSQSSVSDSIRYARAHGRIVLIGAAGVLRSIDWTPVWARELTIVGAFTYGMEDFRGQRKHTFDVVLELMRDREGPDASALLTHTYALDEYQTAIEANLRRGQYKSVKTAFDLRKGTR